MSPETHDETGTDGVKPTGGHEQGITGVDRKLVKAFLESWPTLLNRFFKLPASDAVTQSGN